MFAARKTDNVSSAANYIEDVFSTYLYTGNGKAQSINNGISIGSAVGGGAYFNGTSDYLSLTPLSLSGDFTIEGWVWFRSTASNPISVGDLTSVNKQALRYLNGFNYYNNSGGGAVQGTIALSANQWIHLAVSRVGSTTRIFTNGVLDGSVADSGAFSVRNIGCVANGINMLDGYISNLRVLNGTGLYTSTFTVPTAPLTAITNTVLLICQSPSPFTDNATTPNTITQNGSPAALAHGGPLSSTPAGSGGMVWIKSRSAATDHALYDTARGATFDLVSNSTAAQTTQTDGLISFNTNGFNVGQLAKLNSNAATYASWTFRKQAKFFDVVTYTGNGSNRTIAHNLGSAPGFLIVKRTDSADEWYCYHRAFTADNVIYLNLNNGTGLRTDIWNSTAPTSTVFSLGTNVGVNANGGTYVAYLFAHDAGGFGSAGTDNVITCGSYTGNGSATGPTVTLGYEPQWVMIKKSSAAGTNWEMIDSMRGFTVGSAGDSSLRANLTSAEVTATEYISPTATGFNVTTSAGAVNTSGDTYIYIAIRRGPMKTPTSGTSVFSPVARTGTSAAATMTAGFAPDAVFLSNRNRSATNYNPFYDKLRGNNAILSSNNTGAEQDLAGSITQYTNTGITLGSDAFGNINASGATYINWIFQRAPGFFDVVCYTGTGSNTTFTHNLSVVPEMMIVKRRDTSGGWRVYVTAVGNTGGLRLNSTDSTITSSTFWNNTTPTASVFTVGTNADVNASGGTYVAYLFASITGVSKVGSYTGNGSSQTINCGFTAGARFILIKRYDSTGDWYVYDTARGIVSGNDPQLKLNDTAAEATGYDAIDPDNSGFIVNNDATNFPINVNNATYIYLAIA